MSSVPAQYLAMLTASEKIDPVIHGRLSRACMSLSPESLLSAWLDWIAHLSTSPGKRLDLLRLGLIQLERLSRYMCEYRIQVSSGREGDQVSLPVSDRRFAAEEWRLWPFNVFHQQFLLAQEWWDEATHGVWGVEKHHENVVSFFARQMLDTFAPSNNLFTNPVVLKKTYAESGANLVRGALKAVQDVERFSSGASSSDNSRFVVGKDVGVTPGEVILRNELIELIQYKPATGKVYAEPVLIVPAWIMKYYILDLSPHNSLIKYLVEQGHTVFCISWKNPGWDERNLGMDDYLAKGFHAALGAVCATVPKQKVHSVGYCIGGTLLSIAAAQMARDADDRLQSVTLFAAQTDFSEPGELALFIDDSQVALLEADMAQRGYLTSEKMAGAFQMLRSYDLLWSKMVGDYLLGQSSTSNDLMAWNADATRMPAKMHSQYLRQLFLNNDLSQGRYKVDGQPVSLRGVTVPIFCVGTFTDHVAPWRSVYKIHSLVSGEVTFTLTSGGHNAGIVSPPGHPRRYFLQRTHKMGTPVLSHEKWTEVTERTEGSWWPSWHEWLVDHSARQQIAPPAFGAAGKGYKVLCSAPGVYVMEK